MAIIVPEYNFKGITVPNAYLRISNVSYFHPGRMSYIISAYASKEQSDADERLEDVFWDSTDIEIGDSVPDFLTTAYNDIKGKISAGDNSDLSAKLEGFVDDIVEVTEDE